MTAATAQRTAQVLCQLAEIEDGEGKGFAIETADSPCDIFVVREGDAAYGYVNACPHTGTPLDWTPDKFMSEDSGHIMCATHGALFQLEDGDCIAGPCAGDRLTAVSVTVDDDGRVMLNSDP